MTIPAISRKLSEGATGFSSLPEVALHRFPELIKNLNFQHPSNGAGNGFELIGSGKSKLVFAESSLALQKPHREVASQIEEVVYMISKNRFLNNELKDEVNLGPKIRRDVYLANLEKALQSVNRSPVSSKTLAQKLSKEFPSLELFVDALYMEDRRIKDFFSEYSLDPIDWTNIGVRRLVDSTQHLALDFVVAPSIIIAGQAAVLSKKAECDLEYAVRQKKYRFPENMSLILQLMRGFRDLHAGGYIHQDPKLENVLVYRVKEKPFLKIGDWGKCKKLTENEVGFYAGNHRYMPPERLASQKGEVFGVAMMAIRILEEEFLSDSPRAMLLEPDEIDARKENFLIRGSANQKARRGIERYLSLSKGCPEIDANWEDAIHHVAGSLETFFLKSYPNIDRPVGAYLDRLERDLLAAYGCTRAKKEGIHGLIVQLKEMMKTDRNMRPSMEEALLQLETLLPKISNF